jgi:arabinogalactan oligomer / maltooligosaccharide transport system permease protein
MGLWLAILLNRKLPGKSIIRVLLVLPWAVPEYINALTWKNNMFNSQYGIINIILNKLGVEPLNWLTDATLAFIACIITNIWLGFPFMMMICLGGLQSIPGELYEAADIDGATGWQKFRNITLPLLKPVLLPAAVLSSVWTFNKLTVIYLIANPADPNVHILVSKVYTAAFDNFRFGYAAAFSVIILVIIAFFASSFIRAMKGTEEVY